MKFVETPIFTKELKDHLNDEEYRALQMALLFRPEQGQLIKSGGGLRKIRWGGRGRGKRGGVRLIYFWHVEDQVFYMLYIYPKNVRDDLSPEQVKVLSRLVREELK
jgi:mRNA-degrading endonuclease RelE of RelBE toxin-antitoxin system